MAKANTWARLSHDVHANNSQSSNPLSAKLLIDRIEQATEITIVSAYFDSKFVRSLFDRKRCLAGKTLTLIFGQSNSSAEQRQRLTELRDELRRHGDKKTKLLVAVAGGSRFLHTKLYQFRRTKWCRTLVGSANATHNGFGLNDEVLVEVHGPHLGLDTYIRTLIENCTPCDELSPPSDSYRSFDDLLRDGYIYFKPTRAVSYTVDCFSGHPTVQEALLRSDGGEPLPFHDERSLGSLNVLRLMGIEEDEAKGGDVKKSPFVIETALGYWVPSAFEPLMEEQITKATASRVRVLLARGTALSRPDEGIITRVREDYLSAVERRLLSLNIRLESSLKREVPDRVLKRVKRLQAMLASKAECLRWARTMEGTPMPEIWEDPQSVESGGRVKTPSRPRGS